MNREPEQSLLITKVSKRKKGQTGQKSIGLILDEGVDIGGGGATYTAGDGINIEKDVISVDSDVVQTVGETTFSFGYYSEFDTSYDEEYADECTINNINAEKLEAFLADSGGSAWINFDYQGYGDEPFWSSWAGSHQIIYPDEMYEKTGIDVTVDEGSSWAMFSIRKNLNVNTESEVIQVEAFVGHYKDFCFHHEKDTTKQKINGRNIPAKAFTYLNTLSSTEKYIPDFYASYLNGNVSIWSSATEIGDNVAYGVKTLTADLNSCKKIGDNFGCFCQADAWFRSYSLEEVGDSFLQQSSISQIEGFGFGHNIKVGDSFLANATCPNVSGDVFGGIVAAGSGFMKQANLAGGRLLFTKLEQVGSEAFSGMNFVYMPRLPVLKGFSSWFFSSITTTQDASLGLMNLDAARCHWGGFMSNSELGGNMIIYTNTVGDSEPFSASDILGNITVLDGGGVEWVSTGDEGFQFAVPTSNSFSGADGVVNFRFNGRGARHFTLRFPSNDSRRNITAVNTYPSSTLTTEDISTFTVNGVTTVDAILAWELDGSYALSFGTIMALGFDYDNNRWVEGYIKSISVYTQSSGLSDEVIYVASVDGKLQTMKVSKSTYRIISDWVPLVPDDAPTDVTDKVATIRVVSEREGLSEWAEIDWLYGEGKFDVILDIDLYLDTQRTLRGGMCRTMTIRSFDDANITDATIQEVRCWWEDGTEASGTRYTLSSLAQRGITLNNGNPVPRDGWAFRVVYRRGWDWNIKGETLTLVSQESIKELCNPVDNGKPTAEVWVDNNGSISKRIIEKNRITFISVESTVEVLPDHFCRDLPGLAAYVGGQKSIGDGVFTNSHTHYIAGYSVGVSIDSPISGSVGYGFCQGCHVSYNTNDLAFKEAGDHLFAYLDRYYEFQSGVTPWVELPSLRSVGDGAFMGVENYRLVLPDIDSVGRRFGLYSSDLNLEGGLLLRSIGSQFYAYSTLSPDFIKERVWPCLVQIGSFALINTTVPSGDGILAWDLSHVVTVGTYFMYQSALGCTLNLSSYVSEGGSFAAFAEQVQYQENGYRSRKIVMPYRFLGGSYVFWECYGLEEVVLSGDISLAPSNTYNLSMSTKWQIDNNKPISVIVPSDADMTVFKQKYPNLLSASPYRYLNVSVG